MKQAPQKIGFKETLAWYEQNAKTYNQTTAKKPDFFLIDRFLDKITPGGLILDAGCAGGRDCSIFAQKGYSPIGIDAVKAFVAEAKITYPELNFVLGNFTKLPFADNSFAGVWAHASLLHLETISEVKTALKEFFRVLKSGGIAHIYVKKQLNQEKTSNVSQNYSGEFGRFFRWFEAKELETLIEKAGFEINIFDDNYTRKGGRQDIKWLAVLAKKPK
ncbi:MAG: class I SAM-dependent methyltransferase [Candidatus Pacebacteria bacterium]|nr:class I SAM-dependent methyltransferase [Candidatus Paceibacterota bacterium]